MSRVLLCSVSPESYRFNRTYRHGFVIPSVPKGEVMSSIWVEDGIDIKNDYSAGTVGHEVNRIPITIQAKDIALDYMQADLLEREGVWICEAGKPTDAEIELAREKRRTFLLSRVEEGNKVYAKMGNRGLDQIPDSHKRAARELGLDSQCAWVVRGVVTAPQTVECSGCGTDVRLLKSGQAPAYCPTCKTVLNGELARALAQSNVLTAPVGISNVSKAKE